MTGPFDFVNSIYEKKTYIEDDDAYIPFLINKSLSFSSDCILYANEMNINNVATPRMQYDYLYHSIRAKKRYTKWIKKSNKVDDHLEAVKEYFGYNTLKAKQALAILNDKQLCEIHESLIKGGTNEPTRQPD